MRAGLVDVGGVLTLPHAPTVRRALDGAAVDASDERLALAHDHALRAFEEAGGALGPEDFWDGYTRSLGIDGEETKDLAARLHTTLKAAPRPWGSVRDDAHRGLAIVADRFDRVAIVSNASGQVEQDLADLELCQVGDGPGLTVDAIIDSHVVGVAKPDPRIFHIALERLAVEPSQAVHVGDSVLADVRGAEGAGIRGIHFDPHRLCSGTHPHVQSLAEVEARG